MPHPSDRSNYSITSVLSTTSSATLIAAVPNKKIAIFAIQAYASGSGNIAFSGATSGTVFQTGAGAATSPYFDNLFICMAQNEALVTTCSGVTWLYRVWYAYLPAGNS